MNISIPSSRIAAVAVDAAIRVRVRVRAAGLTQLEWRKRLKAAERELKKQHAFSSSVLAASGAIMFITDAKGRLVEWNQACEKTTGWSFEEMRGKRLCSLWTADTVSRMAREILASPGSREYEGCLPTRSGGCRLITWSITTLRDQHGAVEFIIASGIDITERRRLEEEVLEISGRERQRMGEDLHDGVCQVLGGIDMLASVLAQKLARKSPAEAREASTISGYARQAVAQARALARGLSPVELEAHGLMAALQELAVNTGKLFYVSCEFQCNPPVLIEDNVMATHLYRIAQESIHNAIKHGRASQIILRLSATGKDMTLTITDNGSGFPPHPPESQGMGLRTMNFRADSIGGALEIHPEEPQGTQVLCRFSAS